MKKTTLAFALLIAGTAVAQTFHQSGGVDGLGKAHPLQVSPFGSASIQSQQTAFGSLTNLGATSNQPRDVAAADINGDGNQDVIVANRANAAGTSGITVFLGRGDGSFRPPTFITLTGAGANSVVIGDFNEDGKQDVAVAERALGQVAVLLGNGDGTFQTPVVYATGANAYWVRAARLGTLTHLSLVVSNLTGNSVSVLIGAGDGTFAAHVDYTGVTQPVGIVLADMNDDGYPDIVVGSNGNSFYISLGTSTGTFGAFTAFSSLPQGQASMAPTFFSVIDMNGDLVPDVVFTSLRGFVCVSLALGRAAAAYGQAQCYVAASNANAATNGPVVTTDLNGDGLPDVVTTVSGTRTDQGDGILILYNAGAGVLGSPVFLPSLTQAAVIAGTTSGPWGITSADTNNDGVPDLLYSDTSGYPSATANGYLSEYMGLPQTRVQYAQGTTVRVSGSSPNGPPVLTAPLPPPYSPLAPTVLTMAANVAQGVTINPVPNNCFRVSCVCTVACAVPPVILTGGSGQIAALTAAPTIGWDMDELAGGAGGMYRAQFCLSFQDFLDNETTIAVLQSQVGTCKISQINIR